MSKKSVETIAANANHLNLKNATVTRALPKWVKLPVWDYTENLKDYDEDEAGDVIKGLLEERDATFEADHDGFGYDCLYLKGQDILECLEKGAYYKIPENAEFGVETSRRQGDDGYWFYTNCPYIKQLWEDECFDEEFYSDFHDAIILHKMNDCAKACSKDAASVQKECKALYEEVKDFIADGDPNLDDFYCDGVEIMLKDGAILSFNTDMENFYINGDSSVEIYEEDEYGHPDRSYRDDFVDDCTGYITELSHEVEGDNEYDFVDAVNDAGELYYYSMVKTALTVAKEHMAKWDGIDRTLDDDDEAVAE